MTNVTDVQDQTLVQHGDDITYSAYTGVIDVDIQNTPTSEGDYLLHTLADPLTDTNFVLDFDYKRVSGGTNCFAGLILRSNQSGDTENSTTGDWIRTSPNAAGTSMNMYWHNDGESSETEIGYLYGLETAGNWNYLRLTRVDGTTIKLERFSSAARTGTADASVTATNLDSDWGLDLGYIGGYCGHVGSTAGNGLEEHFDNIDLSDNTVVTQQLRVMFYPDNNVQDETVTQQLRVMFYPDNNVQDATSSSSAAWKWWLGMRYGTRKRYGTNHVRRMRV